MYADPFVREVAQASARVESEGYCRWTRVEEICEFAKKLGYTKIGIATCISFVDLAKTLSGILESHGFTVASFACKHGGVAKEEIDIPDPEKIHPGGHKSMSNPVSLAELLNRAGFASAMTACFSSTPTAYPPPWSRKTACWRTTQSGRCNWPIVITVRFGDRKNRRKSPKFQRKVGALNGLRTVLEKRVARRPE
jgi:hypothetical protein